MSVLGGGGCTVKVQRISLNRSAVMDIRRHYQEGAGTRGITIALSFMSRVAGARGSLCPMSWGWGHGDPVQ